MKTEIVEINELYNDKGELVEHTIIYESGRNYGYFEQLPKKTEKWLERAKREATWIHEAKVGNWTRKTYRKGGHNNGQRLLRETQERQARCTQQERPDRHSDYALYGD